MSTLVDLVNVHNNMVAKSPLNQACVSISIGLVDMAPTIDADKFGVITCHIDIKEDISLISDYVCIYIYGCMYVYMHVYYKLLSIY